MYWQLGGTKYSFAIQKNRMPLGISSFALAQLLLMARRVPQKHLLLLSVLASAICSPVPAASGGWPRSAATACDASQQAIQLVQAFRQEQNIPGLQLAVSVKGQTLLSENMGYADLDKQKPVSNTTQFRIGSVSKSLTSLALVQLVAAHKLDLDAPVQQYVPSFPVKSYPITTRELAGHLAGIRHYRPGDPHDVVRTEHYQTATQALTTFQDDPLLFEPGTHYFYSSFGWNLIGAVMEGVTGDTYLHYMQQHIWLPLGMSHTYGDRADSLMPDRSQFYGASGQVAAPDDLSCKYPSGGLLSTAEDLLKYGNALLDKAMLPATQARLLFTSQATRDGQPTHYGLGWVIGTTRSGHRLYMHEGEVLGGSSYLLLYPDDKMVITFVANSRKGALLKARSLGELFLACH